MHFDVIGQIEQIETFATAPESASLRGYGKSMGVVAGASARV
jgi:hypothetical protein